MLWSVRSFNTLSYGCSCWSHWHLYELVSCFWTLWFNKIKTGHVFLSVVDQAELCEHSDGLLSCPNTQPATSRSFCTDEHNTLMHMCNSLWSLWSIFTLCLTSLYFESWKRHKIPFLNVHFMLNSMNASWTGFSWGAVKLHARLQKQSNVGLALTAVHDCV